MLCFIKNKSSNQFNNLIFSQTLPILLQSGCLTHNQILNLRLIAKPINLLVDQFFQTKKLSWHKSSPLITFDLIPSFYNGLRIEIPEDVEDPPLIKRSCNIQKHVLEHPLTRNPFISRYVRIQDNTHLTSERFPGWHDQVLEFLKRWGDKIWYLNLELKCTTARFLEILNLLPNLKYLKSSGSIGDYGCEPEDDCRELLKAACPQLTSLIFMDNVQYIWEVHDRLISRFSEQLQELHVNTWGEFYSQFDWVNLRKLVVSKVDCLTDLCYCKATNLKELSLEFWARESFDSLLSILKTFQNLEVLRVFFGSNFDMSENKVIERLMGDGNIDKGFCSVKKLRFKIPIWDGISLDFLAWFPMLEYLEIDKVFVVEYESDDDVDLLQEKRDKKKKVELVEIREHLSKYKEISLDKSNIWKVLPFLKQIKINNLAESTFKLFVKQNC